MKLFEHAVLRAASFALGIILLVDKVPTNLWYLIPAIAVLVTLFMSMKKEDKPVPMFLADLSGVALGVMILVF